MEEEQGTCLPVPVSGPCFCLPQENLSLDSFSHKFYAGSSDNGSLYFFQEKMLGLFSRKAKTSPGGGSHQVVACGLVFGLGFLVDAK